MKDYKIIMNFSEFFSNLMDYIYYRKCYICSKKCSDISLCKECIEKIQNNFQFSDIKKFNTYIYTGTSYENEIVKIIRAFKYHKKREFKKILADILIETSSYYNLNFKDFIVCPVPIHKNRFRQRKYNHMELVAEEISKFFNIEMNTTFINRIKDTPPLYKLSSFERAKNISGAFSVSKEIKSKKILLIDDIITTGATISELYKIINNENPEKLIVLCSARSNNCNL